MSDVIPVVPRTLVVGESTTNFDVIRPGDIDLFVFDFTKRMGNVGTIVSVTWICVVSPDSPFEDVTSQDRVIGVPASDTFKTSSQIGMMLEGVVYTLTVITTIDDGRVLSADAEVECNIDTVVVTDPLLTVSRFRQDMPAFSDASTYPNDSIQ
jgi:hypothetical protein